MHALLSVACLQQGALQALMDRLHRPQVATHMASLPADLSLRTSGSGDGMDSTAVHKEAGQMNRQLRGDNAFRRQQAAQPLQLPASFEGNQNRSEWQVHQELDSVWEQHSEAGTQVIT